MRRRNGSYKNQQLGFGNLAAGLLGRVDQAIEAAFFRARLGGIVLGLVIGEPSGWLIASFYAPASKALINSVVTATPEPTSTPERKAKAKPARKNQSAIQ